MGPIAQKIAAYRRDGGDPRITEILYDLGSKQKALEQLVVTLASQFNELAKLLNMHAEAVNNLAMLSVSKRAKQVGVEVSADPHLTGEADED